MDLLKRLLLRPTQLIAQVSSAIHSPSAPRIILKSNHIIAGNQVRGILFVKCPPSQLKSVQIILKGSAKTQGFVNRIHSTPFPTSLPNDAFHHSYTRTHHLAATSYHPIVSDMRTLHSGGRPLISPQSRLPRTLGPGRRPKPIISSPTFRFPFAIQVPQDAPGTHDDAANSAPSSIKYALSARIMHPLPKLSSSHSVPITVYEPPGAPGPAAQERTTTQSTWSLFQPGRISVSVTCPSARLVVAARNCNLAQSLTLAIRIDNESPRECTAVVATLYRRDSCLVTHEHREYRAEHVVALADAEVPMHVPAYGRGREVRVAIPGIEAGGWTPSSTSQAGGFDKVRVGYFVRVKVQVDVGVAVEVDEVPIEVRVGEWVVMDGEAEEGRVRLKLS